MSMPNIRQEVSSILCDVDERLNRAQAELTKGDFEQRVKAAGELAFLGRQKQTLEERLAEIERDPASSETVWQWTREEWFNLSLRLERWFAEG